MKVYGLRVKGLSTHTTITSEDETGKMRQSGGDKQEQSSGGKGQNEQNMTEQTDREQLNQLHTHTPPVKHVHTHRLNAAPSVSVYLLHTFQCLEECQLCISLINVFAPGKTEFMAHF